MNASQAERPKGRKKILVIPSWLPSSEQPWRGVFFIEQAELAAQEFDVRLLRIDSSRVPRRKPLEWVRHAAFASPGFVVTEQLGELTLHALRLRIASMSDKSYLADWRRSVCRGFEQLLTLGWVPDLVHAHCALHAGVAAQDIRSAFGIPYVLTEHQHIIFDYFTNEQWELAKRTYDGAERLAVVSEFEKHMLLMNGVPVLPTVVGNFVDDAAFALKPTPRSTGALNLLFVGITSRLKDRLTFFSALQRLQEDSARPFVANIVVPPFQEGDMDLVKREIASFQLEGRVVVHRSASRAEMVGLLHSADVLVSTSVAETFGVSICEALMCGCPVVVTQSGGVSDFVHDGANGFVVPIADADAVARRICDAVSGKLLLDATGIRDSVRHKYGRAAFLATLQKLYA